MGRLIDADAYLKSIRPRGIADELWTASEAYLSIMRMPPVDAVPVRHGRWETDGIMMDECEFLMTRCTAYGEAYEYGYNMPFCPRCGAKMDSENSGDWKTD